MSNLNTVENPKDMPSSSQQSLKYKPAQLFKLLSTYEAELQAKEIALAVIKAENVRLLIDNLKNNTDSSLVNSEIALLRDANTLGDAVSSEDLTPCVCPQHTAQYHKLEKLVNAQKEFSKKTKHILNALEKRHYKILNELNLEKERTQNNTLKSDEFFFLIEGERLKMQTQLDQKNEEINGLEQKLLKTDKILADEKKREKIIVLYLINERKELLLKLNEMRMRLNSKNEIEDSSLVCELKRQIVTLNNEHDGLSNTINSLQFEKEVLQQKVKHLEEDLLLIQQNILYQTRENSETINRPNRLDGGGLKMANKGAFASEQRFTNRTSPQRHQHFIPASATFPTTQYPSSGFNMPGPSTISMKHQYSSLQKQTSRTPRVSKSSNASVSANKMSNPSMGTNFTNPLLTNNHSTMLLHRPSTRPPLGIKASNLPISRNLSAQQTLGQSSNYKSTMIGGINNKGSIGKKQVIPPSTYISSNSTTIPTQNDYLQQNDYNNTIDSRNDKKLTKRSYSLPRNMLQNTHLNFIQLSKNNN